MGYLEALLDIPGNTDTSPRPRCQFRTPKTTRSRHKRQLLVTCPDCSQAPLTCPPLRPVRWHRYNRLDRRKVDCSIRNFLRLQHAPLRLIRWPCGRDQPSQGVICARGQGSYCDGPFVGDNVGEPLQDVTKRFVGLRDGTDMLIFVKGGELG